MRTRSAIRNAAVPFPDQLIEQVDTGGGAADFVSWYHYAQRLLREIGAYSWSVQHVNETDGEWVVTGRLHFGDDEWYDGVGTDARDPKAAESDAFKRAASKAGYGLHLWAGADYWLEAQLEKDTPS